MAGEINVTLDGKTYDLDDFELGDLEWLEEYIGKPLADMEALQSMKAYVGFVYLIKRRENPQFTIEEARKMPLKTLANAEADEAEVKPAKRPTKAARAS